MFHNPAAKLAAEGTAILYISHKLGEESGRCGDAATILSWARRSPNLHAARGERAHMAELMVRTDAERAARERPPRRARLLLENRD